MHEFRAITYSYVGLYRPILLWHHHAYFAF